jgi:Zn-dependent protease with chaperone function
MSPSKVLKLYYGLSFIAGILLTFVLSHLVYTQDIGVRGAAVMTLCLNVLLVMLLPLVLDWAEQRYFKARFILMEEVASTNPELAALLKEQCQRLAIPNLRLAIVHSADRELFSYGLWRNNARLILSDAFLKSDEPKFMFPSIEAELTRFAAQDGTIVFLLFTAAQETLQLYLLGTGFFH